MFFILTTGRSGSTSIAKYVSTFPGFLCLHEPEPILIKEANLYLYGKYVHSEMVELLRASRASHIEGREYGESNQKLSFIIPALREAFPSGKFIWLARDGRNVVNSIFALGWYDPELLKESMWQMNLPQAPEINDLDRMIWDTMTPFEKCCWYWNFTNRLIQKNLASLDRQQWIFLRLEDVDYRQIHNLLKIKDNPKKLPWVNKKRKNNTKQGWQAWDKKQRTSFEKLCGGLMTELYPGWVSANGEWVDIIRLSPFSMIKHYVQDIMVNVDGKQSLLYKAVSIPTHFVFRGYAHKILHKIDYIYKKISGEL